MRKIICLIIIVVTVFTITVVQAVEMDLSIYTDEELKETLNTIRVQ